MPDDKHTNHGHEDNKLLALETAYMQANTINGHDARSKVAARRRNERRIVFSDVAYHRHRLTTQAVRNRLEMEPKQTVIIPSNFQKRV